MLYVGCVNNVIYSWRLINIWDMPSGTTLARGTEIKMPCIVSGIYAVPSLDYLITSD